MAEGKKYKEGESEGVRERGKGNWMGFLTPTNY